MPGLITGAIYGTLRTQTPILFSLASGAQCFAIGTTFWTARSSILSQTGLRNWWSITRGLPAIPRDDLEPTLSDKVRASTIAGAFTGFSLGFLFRGPQNVIPGTIMFTLFGWGGQKAYNFLDERNSQGLQAWAEKKARGDDKPKEGLMHRFAKSKWSPMTVLSDQEYEDMLQEKLLKVEVEIALIDDRIAEFKKKAEDERVKQELQKVVDGSQA